VEQQIQRQQAQEQHDPLQQQQHYEEHQGQQQQQAGSSTVETTCTGAAGGVDTGAGEGGVVVGGQECSSCIRGAQAVTKGCGAHTDCGFLTILAQVRLQVSRMYVDRAHMGWYN
jgi:hypothetical protein